MNSLIPEQKHFKITAVKRLSSSKFTVYLAKSQTDSKFYAMKVFPFSDQEMNPSFIRELKAVPFDHKNVIKIFDYIPSIRTQCSNQELGYTSYTLMELAPYGDLADFVMSENFRKDDKLVRTIFRHICEGVEYIHSREFAHTDLKLENILIGENFIPKVSDFDSIKDMSNHTKNKIIDRLGTKNSRAPEVINLKCRDAYKADMYSLGVILVTLQSGLIPYLEEGKVDNIDYLSLLIESDPEYFSLHSIKDRLPFKNTDSFKELVFGLTKKNPSKRLSFAEMKKNDWYDSEIYSDEEFAEIMKSCI